jgi:hypothetical protein
MKIIHTTMLIPVLLGGCSLSHNRPADSNAQQFVDTQISTNLRLIELAQKSLKQASGTALSASSPPAKPAINTPSASEAKSLPGTLRGLTSIKSLGTPEAFTLVSVRSRNLDLEATLYKVIPAGWTAIISADLKAKFRQRLTLEANDQWPYVLDGLLRQHGWVALIDWPKKQVSVAWSTPAFTTQPVSVPPAIKSTIPAANKATSPTATTPTGPRNPFSGSRDKAVPAQPVKVAAPTVKAVPSPKIWRAIQGSTLKDTLYSWAAEEKCTGGQSGNWSVAWLTDVNYRIDAPLSFSGSFKDALNGVFRLYTTAAVPLYAGISTSQCLLKVDAKEVR